VTIQEVRAVVMQDDLPIYPIRTVASLTGVDARRLRSWESEYHLLEPARSKGGHRLYSPRDLRLVHLIRRLVDQEGMSLQGIKAFLAAQPEAGDAGPSGSAPPSEGGSEPVEAAAVHAAQPRRGILEGQRGPAKVATAPQAAGSAAAGTGTVTLAARSHNGHGRGDRA
jgi:DNA-binding transcriptional MerR regulator